MVHNKVMIYNKSSAYLYSSTKLTNSIDVLHHTGSINVNENIVPGQGKELFLHIESLGHAALVFVNKKPIGRYSSHQIAVE